MCQDRSFSNKGTVIEKYFSGLFRSVLLPFESRSIPEPLVVTIDKTRPYEQPADGSPL